MFLMEYTAKLPPYPDSSLILVWTKKPFAVEMDQMRRGLCNPDFRFPRNFVEVFHHGFSIKKSRHIHYANF